MNHKIRIMMASALLPLSLGAAAEVVVTDINGGTTKIAIDKITAITFSGDNVNIDTTDGVQTYPIDIIASVSFDLSADATSDITDTLAPGLDVSMRDCILTVNAPEGARAKVFTLGGVIVSQTAGTQFELDLSPLAKGIYIICINDKTIKFIR